MTDVDWRQIEISVDMIRNGNITRLEGKGWLVYKVGNIIRIDIKE
jgi:hypothetical protein